MYKVDLDLTSSKTAENSVTVIFIVFLGGDGPDDVTRSM